MDSLRISTPKFNEERLTGLSSMELVAELKAMHSELERSHRREKNLHADLRKAKEQSLAVQTQVEQEEEYITNKLMKRLGELKKEKQTLANEVEQEEEFLTNTLQKRLDKVLREKVELENQLEAEQEYVMNSLQKKADCLAREKSRLEMEKRDLQKTVTELADEAGRLKKSKVELENQMETEEEQITNKLQRQLEELAFRNTALERLLERSGAAHMTSESDASEDEGHTHHSNRYPYVMVGSPGEHGHWVGRYGRYRKDNGRRMSSQSFGRAAPGARVSSGRAGTGSPSARGIGLSSPGRSPGRPPQGGGGGVGVGGGSDGGSKPSSSGSVGTRGL